MRPGKLLTSLIELFGPDRLESIILKIIGKKIYNPPIDFFSII